LVDEIDLGINPNDIAMIRIRGKLNGGPRAIEDLMIKALEAFTLTTGSKPHLRVLNDDLKW
jgi:hypothetical protein